MRIFNRWHKVLDKLFEMGEQRGEQDDPPRDMPASIALKLLGWQSETPVKKTLSWFDIDFVHGGNEDETSLNSMGFPGEDFLVTDQRGYWTLFKDFFKSFQDKILLKKAVRSTSNILTMALPCSHGMAKSTLQTTLCAHSALKFLRK